jgi:hypothetical protein
MPKYVMRKLFGYFAFVLVLAQVTAFDCHAQARSGAGGPDPYALSYAGTTAVPIDVPTSCDTYGRHPTALQGVDQTKHTLVIIQEGQSNDLNTAPSAFTPVNASKIDNMNICDGGIYPLPSDPVIGAGCAPGLPGCNTPDCASTGCLGNVMTRVADALITAGKFDRVIVLPTSVGGTPVVAWAPGGGLSLYNDRTAVALRRLAAKGITTSTPASRLSNIGDRARGTPRWERRSRPMSRRGMRNMRRPALSMSASDGSWRRKRGTLRHSLPLFRRRRRRTARAGSSTTRPIFLPARTSML